MASRRRLKKDIDYLVGEVISDCHLCLYFHPEKDPEEIIGIMGSAVELRNDLFAKMRPKEKKNAGLVRKHFGAIRNDLMVRIDELFKQLSEKCS